MLRAEKVAKRRGWGEGTIFYDRDNSAWRAAYEAGPDPLTGKRRRIYVRGKTKATRTAPLLRWR